MKMTSIDLFAGAGGLSEGLRQAGFSTLFASELDPVFARSFRINHPEAMVADGDIRGLDAEYIRGALDLGPGELDLMAGGPPCQGFSINAPTRSLEDQRNHLFRDFLRFVGVFKPKALLIENVPGLVSFDNGGTLASIFESLNALGYMVDVKILYAPHYGVPQMRWRTFVLGLRHSGDIRFPTPLHDAPARANFRQTWRGRSLLLDVPVGLPRHTTVSDALSDLPPILPGAISADGSLSYVHPPRNNYQSSLRRGSTGVSLHQAPGMSDLQLKRLQHIPPGGNWTNIPHDLLPAGMKRARRTDHTKRYGRADPDGLASTILTKCDPHWGAYYHYSQDRVFSVREAARLQSFPDDYTFVGNMAQQYKQVGNAVPPMVGCAMGTAVLQSLSQEAFGVA